VVTQGELKPPVKGSRTTPPASPKAMRRHVKKAMGLPGATDAPNRWISRPRSPRTQGTEFAASSNPRRNSALEAGGAQLPALQVAQAGVAPLPASWFAMEHRNQGPGPAGPGP